MILVQDCVLTRKERSKNSMRFVCIQLACNNNDNRKTRSGLDEWVAADNAAQCLNGNSELPIFIPVDFECNR
jgi:hypothetical protein